MGQAFGGAINQPPKGLDAKALLKKKPFRGRILGVDPSLRGTGASNFRM